jgi:translation initiation factor 2B subunit (eIF-2B alpha/beta/delta family)
MEKHLSTDERLKKFIDEVSNVSAYDTWDNGDDENDGFVCGPSSAAAQAVETSSLSRMCANLEYDLEKTRQWAVSVEQELEEYKQSDRSIDQALQRVVDAQAKVVSDQAKEIQRLTQRAEAAEAALHEKEAENENLLTYVNSLVT